MKFFRNTILKFLAVIICLCIASCKIKKIPASATLFKNECVFCEKEEYVIIKTEPDWIAFWEKVNSALKNVNYVTIPKFVNVDFSKNMVVAVVAVYSYKSTSVEITKYKETKDKIILYVRKPNAQFILSVLKYNCHFITIPYTDKPIEFVEID